MDAETAASTGAAIRSLRRGKNWTQGELGVRAGYSEKGAAVAISRIETGTIGPSAAKLAEIAKALGVEPQELGGVRQDASLERRLKMLAEANERQQLLRETLDHFALACESAATGYLAKLIEVSSRIEGEQFVPEVPIPRTRGSDTADEVAYQIDFTILGVAASLNALRGGAPKKSILGTAEFSQSLKSSIVSSSVSMFGELPSKATAATDGYVAALRAGQGSTGGGGAKTLAVIVAAAAAVVGAEALVSVAARKSKRKYDLFAAKVAEVERVSSEIAPNVDVLLDIVPRATAALDYVNVHGSHALGRWSDRVGPSTIEWNSLAQSERDQYAEFADVAAAQVSLSALDVAGLWNGRGTDLAKAQSLAEQLVSQSSELVKRHV